MRKHAIAPITTAVLLALAGTAQAASTKTTTFNVSASVASNCFVQATDMAFGAYTGIAIVDASSDVQVRCSKNAPYTLSLNAGTTAGASFAPRLLTDGTDTLQYNLYTSNAYNAVWGDGTGGSATVAGSGTGLGNWITHTVYGRIPNNAANQAAGVGSYSDSITVTVEY
jgi:spore coat protein U-like protein